jgi:hypothetical protein
VSKNVKVEKNFHIEIIETLSQIVEIVAEDEQSALLKAQQLYRNEQMVLDSEDYKDTKYNIFEWE